MKARTAKLAGSGVGASREDSRDGLEAMRIERVIPQAGDPASSARSWVDDTSWPILKVTLPPYPTDDEIAQYLKILESYRNRRQPYALLIDLTHGRAFSPRQRKMQADYIREGLPISQIYLKGIGYVAESAMKRGAITAIYWLVKPASPSRIFPTRTEALDWLRLQLGC